MPRAEPKDNYEDEILVLEAVRARRPEPSVIQYQSWNLAVSRLARLYRAVSHAQKPYREMGIGDPLFARRPFKDLEMRVIKPGSIIFIWKSEAEALPEPLVALGWPPTPTSTPTKKSEPDEPDGGSP